MASRLGFGVSRSGGRCALAGRARDAWIYVSSVNRGVDARDGACAAATYLSASSNRGTGVGNQVCDSATTDSAMRANPRRLGRRVVEVWRDVALVSEEAGHRGDAARHECLASALIARVEARGRKSMGATTGSLGRPIRRE